MVDTLSRLLTSEMFLCLQVLDVSVSTETFQKDLRNVSTKKVKSFQKDFRNTFEIISHILHKNCRYISDLSDIFLEDFMWKNHGHFDLSEILQKYFATFLMFHFF